RTGLGCESHRAAVAGLAFGLPGDERFFPRQPDVHAGVRGGLARRENCPTGCWTIALGPQPRAAVAVERPGTAAGLRRKRHPARLVAQRAEHPYRNTFAGA